MKKEEINLNHLATLKEVKLHSEILKNLLEQIQPVNFQELAGISPDDKPKISQLQVICIEQILYLAKKNNWGLCIKNGSVYVYNGSFWQQIEAESLNKFLGEAAEKMGIDPYKARYYQFREQLYKQFIAAGHLSAPIQKNDVVLINLKNGTFEISQHGTKLKPFDQNDFLTYQLQFYYNPDAKAPLFEKYINRVLPDKNLQNILCEYLGYIFIPTKTLKLEKVLLLYGPGANGKSVLYDVINELLGSENVCSYSLQSLTNETGYFRATLGNKLLNYASEISGNLQTGIFKAMASGEPIEARLPYGNPFILTNYAKLIFNTNVLPRDIEFTKAYFRRFLIIPFNETIPDEEQDVELSKKIIDSELAGVFNWVLAGLNRLLIQKKFTHSDIVKRTVDAYESESDTVKQFLIDSEYKSHHKDYVLYKTLYSQYRQYCNEGGFKSMNLTHFGSRLKHLKINIERKSIGNVVFVSQQFSNF